MRIPILGRPDLHLHLFEVTRAVSTDKTAIGGLPMQSLKLVSSGWSCDRTGASGSVTIGVGSSDATAETVETPVAEEADANPWAIEKPASDEPEVATPAPPTPKAEVVEAPAPADEPLEEDGYGDFPAPEPGGYYT